MRETEKRIKRYEARLPVVREKIFASLALFALAISMLAVATFSWVTLSIAPDVSGITTTIVANGNLEIALVDKDGGEPNATTSDDGNPEKSLAERNITWGNLVNLSDPTYGLDKITLRPASLNAGDLLSKPLYAASYTADGRIQRLDSDFQYTAYNSTTNTFDQSTNRGIRAISSVKFETVKFDDPLLNQYVELLGEAEQKLVEARMAFNGLATGKNPATSKAWMEYLSNLIATYTNGVLRSAPATEVCNYDDVVAFYRLMETVDEDVLDAVGEMLIIIFDIYQRQTDNLKNATTNESVVYEPAKFNSLDEFCSGAMAELAKMNQIRKSAGHTEIVFSSLKQYIQDRALLHTDMGRLYDIVQPDSGVAQTITWGQIEPIANDIIKISTVEINGKTMSQWFGSLKNNISGLMSILNGSASDNEALVKDGLMKRLDALLHNGSAGFYVKEVVITFDKAALKTRLDASGVGFAASMVGNQVKAHILTDALTTNPQSTSTLDMAEANEIIAVPSTDVKFTAQDTYGLALDLWLRTNHTDSYLILEGDVDTISTPVSETVQYMPSDADTMTTLHNVPIYLADIVYTTVIDYTDEAAEDTTDEYTLVQSEIFQVKENGTDVWYQKSSGQKLAIGTPTVTAVTDDNDVEIGTRTVTVSFRGTPAEKVNIEIVGYSGANRVWKEEDLPFDYDKATSTTQGSGSCYTFYTDSPEDMAQSLELVAALKVAFVDSETGKLMASAYFDTEKYYSEYGKVTVPLYLDETCEELETSDGKIRVIHGMEKNKATMITAIVYLDGTVVTNEKVLSSSEIDGTLNIQFGSYTRPDALKDDELASQVRKITASLDKEYDFTGEQGEDRDVTVLLEVTGSTPKKIEANFIRVISQTHGSRHETFSFTRGEDGIWRGTIRMVTPGQFILRSVIVDGIEYNLNQDTFPTVNVPGISLDLVSGERGELWVYRTADNIVTEKFTIKVAADAITGYPTSVKGVFQSDTGATITTNYKGMNDTWTANVAFSASGNYTMKYVIIDGEYFEMTTPIVRQVYTGLYTRVTLQAESADHFSEEEELSFSGKGISYFYVGVPHEFKVNLEIFDSSHKEMNDLGNIQLYYTNGLFIEDFMWDNTKGCYTTAESFLITKPGSFSFNFVSVSGETLDKAVSAPTITAATKDPVRYLGIAEEIDNYIVDLDGGTAQKITLEFENAPAGEVYGLFVKGMSGAAVTLEDGIPAGAGYVIMKAENNSDDSHSFHIPAADGYWTLVDVKVATVYDGVTQIFYNGNPDTGWPTMHGEYVTITDLDAEWEAVDQGTNDQGEQYDYYYDIDDLKFKSDVHTTKVVGDLKITHNLNSYGKSANGTIAFSGTFMQEHKMAGIQFRVTDFEGLAVGDGNVELSFVKVGGTTLDYGGYSYDGQGIDETFTLENAVASPTEITGDLTLRLAGQYNIALTFALGDERITIGDEEQPGIEENETVPAVITVSSTKPTLSIESISPEGAHKTVNSSDNTVTVTSKREGNTITIFPDCEVTGSGCNRSGKLNREPKVTLKFTGLGHATNATLTFTEKGGAAVRLYAGSSSKDGTQTDAFIWDSTTGESVMRFVGYNDAGNCDSSMAAGTLISSDKVIMTYGEETYTVAVSVITIINEKP